MTYSDLDAILRGVCPKTYHYLSPAEELRYITWQESYGTAVYGDDRRGIRADGATIHIATQDESDTLVEDVCAALDYADVCYTIISTGFDEEFLIIDTVLEVSF